MYLGFLFVTISLSYFAVSAFFTYFFENRRPVFAQQTIVSLTVIVAITSAAFFASIFLPDKELGNRILHAFGGGFAQFLACFFAARDMNIRASRLKIFIFSFMAVTTLGVFNELMEFFLQSTVGLQSAETITDTWLDLVSNTVGILLSALVTMPFLHSDSQ